MSEFIEIIKSKMKSKEKTALLAAKLKENKKYLTELMAYFEKAPMADRGTCIEAIEYITIKDPGFADSCLDFVIAQINDKNPRVKWEAARVVANAARKFPERSARAIPALLKNIEDEGTVVRWSAAKGLTEIAKYNQESQRKLLGIFSKIVEQEENNGVKSIYIKALKAMEKGEGSNTEPS